MNLRRDKDTWCKVEYNSGRLANFDNRSNSNVAANIKPVYIKHHKVCYVTWQPQKLNKMVIIKML